MLPRCHEATSYLPSLGTFEGQVFEESELEFCVQENEVISALNLVLPLMNFGEKCEIVADPDFAYGNYYCLQLR